jgi:hypothetical protein
MLKDLTFNGKKSAACPFCKGDIEIVRAQHPERSPGRPEDALMHTLPTCSRYENEDPSTFLESVSAELRKKWN